MAEDLGAELTGGLDTQADGAGHCMSKHFGAEVGLGVPRGVILQPSPCGLSSRREALHPRAPAPSQETLSS